MTADAMRVGLYSEGERMKAIVHQEPHKVTVEQMPDPKIEA
jgi:hypothetical protein